MHRGDGPILGAQLFQRNGSNTFAVHHRPCRPAAHPETPICPKRSFTSYGQWFEAHLPVSSPRQCLNAGKSSTFWPYGKSVTSLTNTASEDALYSLDSRTVRNVLPHKPLRQADRSSAAAPALARRAHSTSALFGGHAEVSMAGRPARR